MFNLTENWNLEDIYKDEQQVALDFEKIKKIKSSLAKYRGKLKDENVLLDYLKKAEELSKLETKVGCYTLLRKSLNGKDTFSRKLETEQELFDQEISPRLAFITPEISKISSANLRALALKPSFKNYNLMLEDLAKNKKHVLPEKISAILNMNPSFGSSSEVYDNFSDIDLKFGKVKTDNGTITLTHGTYSMLIKNKNQEVRKIAYNKMHKAFASFNYTLGELYLSYVKESLFFTKLHKFNTVLEECCNDDKSDIKVLPTLIEVVRENLPLFYRFESIKKKYLKLKTYYYFDNYVELGKVERAFSYSEGANLVLKALSEMGEEYTSVLKTALSEGWIDVYEKPAKASGGFCLGVYGVHPYVLLNYSKTYDSVSTLAHELGHAMHFYYTSKNQPITKSEAGIFVCEVASIVNEILLASYMIKNSENRQEKLYYLHQLLLSFYTTLYRQTMFSEFEYFVYTSLENKKPIILEDLNNKYMALQNLYFGKEAKKTKYSKFEWSRIPHFYRPYYVYKYSTGFISACTIANKILSKEEGYIKKYIDFLSAGSSVDPIELLKKVDVDLTKKQTLKGAFSLYESLLNEFENLTKE